MQLVDQFLRKINYLRVSVTDRCDLRCVYCMKEKMNFLPKSDVLSLEEIERLCDNFIELGVEKIRLTGGEPLVRKDIIHLIKNLNKKKSYTNLKEITLTTNGTLLKKYAKELKDNGIKRINVSLDTIVKEKYINIEIQQIRIKDPIIALAKIANEYRKQYNLPIVGITGSNGKTSTKELLKHVLSKQFNVHSTLSNQNTLIGLSLNLLRISNQHDISILEIGASKKGEIKRICKVAQPTHGLITNIHDM